MLLSGANKKAERTKTAHEEMMKKCLKYTSDIEGGRKKRKEHRKVSKFF